jgi:hypothetical protein
VNKILIQELFASTLRYLLCNKTKDYVKGLLTDAIRDGVVVHP